MYMTTKEVAELIGVSKRAVENWVQKDGLIPDIKKPVRFIFKNVIDWLNNGRKYND